MREIQYKNFEIENIDRLFDLIRNQQELIGLNVTVPYKKRVLPFLSVINPPANKIGAVNTIKIQREGYRIYLIGYNTDYSGFKSTLIDIDSTHKKALILGTGGAAMAVAYALDLLGISYKYVSRKPSIRRCLKYKDLSEEIMKKHTFIINATPLGMHPNISEAPKIPFDLITENHFCYDLIYNPEKTKFLRLAEKQGARIKNGEEMFYHQANESWRIWHQ